MQTTVTPIAEQHTQAWAITHIEHPGLRDDVREHCQDCLDLAPGAVAHGRATGTPVAQVTNGSHSVTVRRSLGLVTL